MSEIKNLNPECIWRNFDALTQVPRPSGHLEKVQEFLLGFAARAGVEILNATPAEITSGNGADFFIQAERDGQWYALETLQDEYANTAEAYVYETDVPRELTLNWTAYYGSLSPGRYRVCKWFFEYRGPGDTTDFLLAAEFTLE